ncbi:MAG TPA: LLM class F420-dependent oxidoreductase [Acidimicrobiales bacterium]|nr:LLM class F420-dependent oxidoreductase [Acidimicrobiales bacterium]
MLVDGGLGLDPSDAVETARRAEADGFDGLWCAETSHDPFLPLLLAAEHTERIQLGTGIAVAFARNPMSTAVLANDLHRYSQGRFMLGLGSQIKPHIEKRYAMPWSRPAARMREFVMAMRAIWTAWQERSKLAFRGDFYTHTLMTPMFDPGPNPYGTPRVFVAAVGERMTEVAGEVADGLLAHGFTTERYMRERSIPALERGLARGGRTRSDFEVSYPAMVITGTNEDEMRAAEVAVKAQLSFYASTPAYRPVLDIHGWGDLFGELNALSKKGQWGQMAELIHDDMLDAFAVRGEPEEIPRKVIDRYGDLVTRVSVYAPYRISRERWSKVLEGFRAG